VLERVEQVFSTVVDRLGELATDVTGGTAATRGATERLASLVAASDDVRACWGRCAATSPPPPRPCGRALTAAAEEQLGVVQARLADVSGVVQGSADDTRTLQERVSPGSRGVRHAPETSSARSTSSATRSSRPAATCARSC
jgi:hypothetical protein